MAITTYAELKTAVANWMNRSDLTARIPEFIAIGESKIATGGNSEVALKTRFNEKRITADISTEYADLPSDFLVMRNIQLDTDPITKLRYLTPEQMDRYVPNSTQQQPYYYTINGNELQLRPIPDQEYTVQMTYWYRLSALTNDADTNTILTKYPDLYLYAAMSAAQPFLDKGTPNYEGLFDAQIRSANSLEKIGRFSGTTIISRSASRPE